ncbi:glucan biosynthesis protein D [Aquicoccus sp. SCR17]|nr:glucan biosynthesis protein D [Carideicomes alvinocaridis]
MVGRQGAAGVATGPGLGRRGVLGGMLGSVATLALPPLRARAQEAEASQAEQDAAESKPQAPEGQAFSFDDLSERMRLASLGTPREAEPAEGFFSELDYDDYQRIRFRPERARWQDDDAQFRVNAFHLGWLFEEAVAIYEVQDGIARKMTFSTDDFEYHDGISQPIPEHSDMPGVAGFRLNAPLNRADLFDELIAFLGASYFRALGRDNVYGLSARGLAVNTGLAEQEEFPRFTAFWLERPAPGDTRATIYAALESRSITGAYRFVVEPGETTVVDVTARLYLRRDIQQLGLAPLTSMYLFGDSDPGDFEDYRPRVHDSEALVLNTRGGQTFYRSLNNPPRLASSYLGALTPVSFGLVQRTRDFDHYLDAQAHYERRPSLMVEPVGDWGKGAVRLVEIPSDLEGNDNIVAFWVPDQPTREGDALEVAYRLHWGMTPPGAESSQHAHVLRARVGKGGISGVKSRPDRRKFVVDFEGGLLAELPPDADVTAAVTADRGEVVETVLSRIDGTDTWRLVTEVRAEPGSVVELRAAITGFGRELSETWLYQWVKE